VQSQCGQCCAELGCMRPPAGNRRFCPTHQHLEAICAVYLRANLPNPPAANHAFNWRMAQNGAMPANPHPNGHWCGRPRAPGHIVCDNPYCLRMEALYAKLSTVNPQPGGDQFVFNGQMQYRLKERSFHRFARCYLFGHFFFVCACGAKFTAHACQSLNADLQLVFNW
jgi:hypothetical protein